MLNESNDLSVALPQRDKVFFAHDSCEIGRHILTILKSFGVETCRFEGESVCRETGALATAFIVTGRKEFCESDLLTLHQWDPDRRISMMAGLSELGIIIPSWAWNIQRIIILPQPTRPDIFQTPTLKQQLRKLCMQHDSNSEPTLQAQFWPGGRVPIEHMRSWDLTDL